VLSAVASFSFITHFQAIVDGVIDLRDVVYFASLIAFWLFANTMAIAHRQQAG